MLKLKYLFSLFFLLSFLGCDAFKRSQKQPSQVANQFQIPETPGWLYPDMNLSTLDNRVIILNFWASWCAPCQEEMPALLKLISEQNENVALVAISGDASLKDMKKFLTLFPKFKNPQVFIGHDVSREWIQNYAVKGFPETFIFGKDKKLVKKYQGYVDFQGEEIQNLLKELITKKID